MRGSAQLFRFMALIFFILFMVACQDTSNEFGPNQNSLEESHQLFTNVSASHSGIHFQNKLEETTESNYYQYMYTYIGGGVGAGDFNNDGLVDLFFVSNQNEHQLYLNKGNLQFTNITEKAGIAKKAGFDVGVTLADVNADGFLDIYLTRGGWIQADNAFANQLYLNNGVGEGDDLPTFTESAKEYGIADNNRGISSVFFDYDRDGDLDLYIANSPDFDDPAADIVWLKEVPNDPKTKLLMGSDKLYQNNGKEGFKDVSVAAGILPDIGFGLNPQVGDFNNDGWLDIYVCNDFRIPDFVYLNNQDGTFSNESKAILKHMSFNSMGSDIADINNDGLPDIYTLDMNPEDYIRSKTTMGMTPQWRFEEMVEKDYHYQYMHNMLQLNNGNGTYSEVANMAGIANTDWSWACLLADFDLDGFNDAFVTNGVFRDVIDRDANNNILQTLRENQRKPTKEDFLHFAQMLPQQKLNNYFFRNSGDLTFEDVSDLWVENEPTFSNGATYADLDNDGDLEVIVNNINQEATILKNNAIENKLGQYLQVSLQGPEQNVEGIGAVVYIYLSDQSILYRQQIRSRGYLSSVSNILHFGIPGNVQVEKLEIVWPDGKIQVLAGLPLNQMINLDYQQSTTSDRSQGTKEETLFQQLPFAFSHTDPTYNDYSKQILLPHKLSQLGPAVAIADVNHDGMEDVFLGGGYTQAGQLLLAQKNGSFKKQPVKALQIDRRHEDLAACFFDLDNDGNEDLYVASGSYEFNEGTRLLQDRIYLGDGQGRFEKANDVLPMVPTTSAVVSPADFDGDGDTDLFIGGRVLSGKYPYPPLSYLLINEGGKLVIGTSSLSPDLERIGMVTDASWTDIDGDSDLDLLVTGEWMGIEVFLNQEGILTKSEAYPVLHNTKGWWNKLVVLDIDHDNDLDIIAGNAGLNTKFHPTAEHPFHVYTDDFDYNGTVDVFLAKYYNETQVPVRGKTCTSQQLPHLVNKIKTYEDFANRDIEGIIGPGIASALHYEVNEFRSGVFINEGERRFAFQPFDNEVQQSVINSILYEDFDGDSIPDLLLAGNNHMPEIETTRYDAGIGGFLKGEKTGKFTPISYSQTGFFADKDVRHLAIVKGQPGNFVLVINNNDQHQFFRVNGHATL